jgi:ribosome production factor 1
MITTAKQPRPTKHSYDFIKDFMELIPKIYFYKRKGYEIKQICEIAASKGFTDLIVVSEDHKAVNSLWLIHLPGGPTAHFKLSSLKVRAAVRARQLTPRILVCATASTASFAGLADASAHPCAQLCRDIKGHGNPTGHRPELILNNFNTRLGKRMGRMIAALFPLDPQFKGRRVVTCHNQRDFLFFRHHRYIFEEGKKKNDGPVRARLQELGPQFTLKLRSLQLGPFDTTGGEYEWYHKTEMDTSRRRFHL